MKRFAFFLICLPLFAEPPFRSCAPGLAERATNKTERPRYLAREGAVALEGEYLVCLTRGAKAETVVVRKMESWELATASWWPTSAYSANEYEYIFAEVADHEAWRRPYGVFSTSDPDWPLVVVFESSAPCPSDRRRAAK